MTSVLGISMPKIGISGKDLSSPKNIALGGIAATSVIAGGVIGAIRHSPLKGLGIGAAVAGVALGAALLGNASSSYRDGYCDDAFDPDCDYPGTGGYGDPYYPRNDYPRNDYPRNDYPRNDYPSGGYPDPYYPGGGTSQGDTY